MRLTACITFLALAGCAHHNRTSAATPASSSANTITAEDIDHAPGLSLEQLLVTRIPGLSLSRAADGHLVIHIRGTSTLLGDEEPLFVVNGLALETPIGGDVGSLKPHDIQSISALADSASPALYSGRGGKSGTLIKTKKS